MKSFVIITPGRSGSTYLCKLLDLHPELVCEEEIFNRSRNDSKSLMGFSSQSFPLLNRFFNRDLTLSMSWNWILAWIWRRFLKKKWKSTSYYGFKITIDQLEAYPSLLDFIANRSKVILLTRKDKLRQTLSLIKARKTDNYDGFESKPLSFDTNQVLELHFKHWEWENSIKEKAIEYIIIEAESLFDNPKPTLKRILEFLNVDPLSEILENAESKRLNPKDMNKWVTNFRDIQKPFNEMSLE